MLYGRNWPIYIENFVPPITKQQGINVIKSWSTELNASMQIANYNRNIKYLKFNSGAVENVFGNVKVLILERGEWSSDEI